MTERKQNELDNLKKEESKTFGEPRASSSTPIW